MFKIGDLVTPKNNYASQWYENGLRLAEVTAVTGQSIAIHILAYEGNYYDIYTEDDIDPVSNVRYFSKVPVNV